MFDVVVVAVLVLGFARGLTRGLISTLAGLVALVVGVWGAARWCPQTEELLAPYLGGLPTRLIAFGVTLAVVVALVHFASNLLQRMLKAMMLGAVNRVLGGLFGAAQVLFIVSCVVGLVERLWPGGSPFMADDGSWPHTYALVQAFSQFVFPYIDQGLDAVRQLRAQ